MYAIVFSLSAFVYMRRRWKKNITNDDSCSCTNALSTQLHALAQIDALPSSRAPAAPLNHASPEEYQPYQRPASWPNMLQEFHLVRCAAIDKRKSLISLGAPGIATVCYQTFPLTPLQVPW
jgi:hypothetical protein